MNNIFYVYANYNLITNEIFYIGKGNGNRLNSKKGRNKGWRKIVNEFGFYSIILEKDLMEEDAYNKEVYWIKKYGTLKLGTGPLVNLTEGGDGVRYGTIKGNIPWNKDKKTGQIPWNKDKELNDETKIKISNKLKGNIPWNKDKKTGQIPWNKDKELDNNIKSRISETLRNSIWINNGIINKKIQKNDPIPDGFIKGRLGKKWK